MMTIGQRQRIVEETDGSSSQSQLDDMDDDDAVRDAASKLRQPSNEALAKFEDYCECGLYTRPFISLKFISPSDSV